MLNGVRPGKKTQPKKTCIDCSLPLSEVRGFCRDFRYGGRVGQASGSDAGPSRCEDKDCLWWTGPSLGVGEEMTPDRCGMVKKEIIALSGASWFLRYQYILGNLTTLHDGTGCLFLWCCLCVLKTKKGPREKRVKSFRSQSRTCYKDTDFFGFLWTR